MNIKQLLEIAKIKPNPKLDQYFLHEDAILAEEVELAKINKSDVVLEIGAGIGNLTILLSKKAPVIAVEKDYAFSHVLKNMPNVQVFLGDALEFLESLRSKGEKKKADEIKSKKARSFPVNPSPFNKIVSNIPYSISQPLLLELFRHKWDVAVLIVQKEFAEKLVSKERLGLILSELADIKIIKTVPANAFYPVAVTSSLILIKQKKLLDDGFWNFVSKLKPNKDVSNQVKSCPKPLSKKKVHQLTLAELKTLYKLKK